VAILAIGVLEFLPIPLTVDTATVSAGPMLVTIDAEGRTRVRDLFVLSAPVSGELARVEVEEGERVSQGAAIATIHPPALDPLQGSELEKRIDAAEAIRRQAESMAAQALAASHQAERERDRLVELVSTGAISRQQSEQAATAAEVAAKTLLSARHQAQAALADVEALKARRSSSADGRRSGVVLRAPGSGRVLRVLEKSRRMLLAGTPIVQIGDPTGLEVVVDLLSSDAVRVDPGDTVVFDGWGGEERLRGRVKYIEPAAFTKVSALGIEEQRVNVICEFIDDAAKLGDGYRLDAHIVVWNSPRIRKIPVSALFRTGAGWNVFTIRDGKARQAVVRLGHRNALEAEILDGLGADERIILYPSDKVAEGVKVEGSEQKE
jgi:HlyD family secretion protein